MTKSSAMARTSPMWWVMKPSSGWSPPEARGGEKDRKLFRAYERTEDWSPDELELARSYRAQWAEEHTPVWTHVGLADS
jgi:hypothetical protein